MPYEKIPFVNQGPPGISAERLNYMQTQYDEAKADYEGGAWTPPGNTVKNAGGIPELLAGTLAERPQPGTVGRCYFATDTGEIYRDTGSAWELAAASQAGYLAHLGDTVHVLYAVASGSANAYAVTLNPAPTGYTEGMALAVKINIDNTGASTINVNGLGAKSIKKPNGSDVAAGNLKAGSIYTLRYNGTNFILQGSDAAGNATPADVLSGKTFSNDSGDQVGTMPNQGAVNITPGTVNQAIPAGYHNGLGVVAGDANLVVGNIRGGITIFGVTGTVVPSGVIYLPNTEFFTFVQGYLSGNYALEKTVDYLRSYNTNTAWAGGACWATSEKVDITPFTKCRVLWDIIGSYDSNYHRAIVAFVSSVTADPNTASHKIVVPMQNSTRTYVQSELDVSGLNGLYHISVGLSCISGGNGLGTTDVRTRWLILY